MSCYASVSNRCDIEKLESYRNEEIVFLHRGRHACLCRTDLYILSGREVDLRATQMAGNSWSREKCSMATLRL
jgi:hypothetical protein